MNGVTLQAKAKINITLDVIGRRENGYHDLQMIMQSVNLHDTIKIRKTKYKGIRLRSNYSWLPNDEKNIAYRAVQVFEEALGEPVGIAVEITKRIPVAAGLAGGSTDAAAVLVGLNKMYDNPFSRDKLMELGLKLGADVPFCILRGTVLAEGIGEVLTPLEPMPPCYVVLAKPSVSVSTASVYKSLQLDQLPVHPDTPAMIQAIKDQDLGYIATHMVNVLETVTEKEQPVIVKIKEMMLAQGAIGSMMSGSGPTVFGLFKTKAEANKAANELKFKLGLREVHVTTTYQKAQKTKNHQEASKRGGRGYERRYGKHED